MNAIKSVAKAIVGAAIAACGVGASGGEIYAIIGAGLAAFAAVYFVPNAQP